jgi:hypothetical protein
MALVITVLILVLVVVLFVAFLRFAARHHRKTWGDEPHVMESDEESEPPLWLGQQR